MSKNFRKALKEEVKSYTYDKPENGYKIYAMTYGGEMIFTLEVEEYHQMNKREALASINNFLTSNGEQPVNNINKVAYFRVA